MRKPWDSNPQATESPLVFQTSSSSSRLASEFLCCPGIRHRRRLAPIPETSSTARALARDCAIHWSTRCVLKNLVSFAREVCLRLRSSSCSFPTGKIFSQFREPLCVTTLGGRVRSIERLHWSHRAVLPETVRRPAETRSRSRSSPSSNGHS